MPRCVTEKRAAEAQALEARLIEAYPSETARKLPEYDRHQADITAAFPGPGSSASHSGVVYLTPLDRGSIRCQSRVTEVRSHDRAHVLQRGPPNDRG